MEDQYIYLEMYVFKFNCTLWKRSLENTYYVLHTVLSLRKILLFF